MALSDPFPPVVSASPPQSEERIVGAADVHSPSAVSVAPIPRGSSTSPRAEPPDPRGTASSASPKWLELTLLLFIPAIAFLLASFPARNSDLWMHLAKGRLLAQGEFSFAADSAVHSGLQGNQPWLYDLVCYGLYSAFGGEGLVLFKALLVAGIAVLLLGLSRTNSRWWIPIFATALALLAMSTRLLLQPATISYLFLALTLWFLREREEPSSKGATAWLPRWPLFVLFAVWANADSWFVLGLGAVALVWTGQSLDEAFGAGKPRGSWLASFLRRGWSLALLTALCLLNPSFLMHPTTFFLHLFPAEMGWLPYWEYLTNIRASAAGLAYIPLLVLGLLSFVLNLPRWHWQRFLPWLGLAVLSAFQARAIPFFAVVAGPVLAWNLHEYLACGHGSRREQMPSRQWTVFLGRAVTVMVVLGLALCAWPGWHQVPPFEPRRWAIETAPSLESGAEATKRWLEEGKLGADARGLHLSLDTANAFAWFCPQEKGLRDDQLASAIREGPNPSADWKERMRAAGVNHVILYDSDRSRLFATMGKLLEDPQQWPLLYVEGYLAVFGWRDPAAGADAFRSWQLDINRLAFHPTDAKKAPREASEREPEGRIWWEAFWKPSPPRPIDQDEATLHLFHAEASSRAIPARQMMEWEASQFAALAGVAGSWAGPASLADASLRLTLLRPQPIEQSAHFQTLPLLDQLAYASRQQYSRLRDDMPPALLLLAVRAARRAVAANPDDAQAYLVLGESYLRLIHSTRERLWGEQMPELVQLRHAQASAALNQAINLKPDLAQAHISLSRLYGEIGFLDLALEHLRTYLKLLKEASLSQGGGTEHSQARIARVRDETDQLTKEVERRQNSYEVATEGWKVADRAFRAAQEGLAGKARDLLLDSDIAAFGSKGVMMELELLLRTGRPKAVSEWTTPDHMAAVGPSSYHWLRVQALAASGDYGLAREECGQLYGSLGFQGQQPVRFREVLSLMVGQRVLDEQNAGRSLPDLFRLAMDRSEFMNRTTGIARSLKREADVITLWGLLALEEGAMEEAKMAFRRALSYWSDAATADSGGGLDFNGRPIVQGYMQLLE